MIKRECLLLWEDIRFIEANYRRSLNDNRLIKKLKKKIHDLNEESRFIKMQIRKLFEECVVKDNQLISQPKIKYTVKDSHDFNKIKYKLDNFINYNLDYYTSLKYFMKGSYSFYEIKYKLDNILDILKGEKRGKIIRISIKEFYSKKRKSLL